MILFRDLLAKGERPLALSFPNIVGNAYTMLNVQEHIVVLTSRAVYIFKDLALRFLKFLELGTVESEPVFMRSFAVEAADVHPFRGSKFLIVLPDAVAVVDLKSLLTQPATSDFAPQQTNGTWQQGYEATQGSLELLGA